MSNLFPSNSWELPVIPGNYQYFPPSWEIWVFPAFLPTLFLRLSSFFLLNSRLEVRIKCIQLFTIEYAFIIMQLMTAMIQHETAWNESASGRRSLCADAIFYLQSVSGFGNTMRETFEIHAVCFKFIIYLLYFDNFGKPFRGTAWLDNFQSGKLTRPTGQASNNFHSSLPTNYS